jgi:hypothetical protein
LGEAFTAETAIAALLFRWRIQDLQTKQIVEPAEGLVSMGSMKFALSRVDRIRKSLNEHRPQNPVSCSNEAEVRHQIRKTLKHELWHYFGMTEEQLKDV